MTKNELKSALTAAGVEFRAKANVAELTALYEQHIGQLVDGEPAVNPDDFEASEEELAQQVGRTANTPEEEPEVVQPQPRATGTGLKIEKEREERNGIKRPSIGGKCRAVWDALDAYRAETGEVPSAQVVRDLAADEGWNPNNASIEFYQWRKFNGITGRAPKAPAPTPEQVEAAAATLD